MELVKKRLRKSPGRSLTASGRGLPDEFRGSGECLGCRAKLSRVVKRKFQFCDEDCVADLLIAVQWDHELRRHVSLENRRYVAGENGSVLCRN